MVKRYIFAYEGVKEYNHYLVPGAMQFPENVPVLWQFDISVATSMLGRAYGFERSEKGELSCLVEWFPGAEHAKALAEHGDITASCRIGDLQLEHVTDGEDRIIGTEIHGGTLQEISFVIGSTMPRPLPTEENDDEKPESMEGS